MMLIQTYCSIGSGRVLTAGMDTDFMTGEYVVGGSGGPADECRYAMNASTEASGQVPTTFFSTHAWIGYNCGGVGGRSIVSINEHVDNP